MEAVGPLFGICDICKEPMDDARILPCFHSFCLKCLEKNRESPKCPTCELDFQMPHGGLKNLKKNVFVEYLVSFNVNCDSCKENQAAKFCIECAFNYCPSCLVHHERIPVSRFHNLQESRRLITEDNYPICSKHLEGDTLFCTDCNVLVCGQHLASKHNSHAIVHASDHLSSVKAKLEQNIKNMQKMIKYVEKNYESSEEMLSCNNLKASILKKTIQEQGKELNEAVDYYTASLLKHVDEELTQHQDEADKVMKALKSRKETLSAQVEALRQQLNDLSYESLKCKDDLNYKNNIERPTSSASATTSEIVPKYSDNFCISFSTGLGGKRLNLEKAFGTLKKKPKFRSIKEVSMCSLYKTFAANGEEIFACDLYESKIDVLGYDGSVRKSRFELNNELSRVMDLLLIDSSLYVSGICCKYQEGVKVVKVNTKSPLKPVVICKLRRKGYFLRMAKSICGSLSVFLDNEILHLTEDGEVTKTVTLESQVYDAMQLDDRLYVVCCTRGVVSMVNDAGKKIARYSPSKKSNSMMPSLAKDVFGNIYVNDLNSVVSVLDYNLNVVSHHTFDHGVYKMSYCEEINELLVLTANQKLCLFEL